jgi:charged multivesicular body protein 1
VLIRYKKWLYHVNVGSSTVTSTPAEQVDTLINQIADEYGLDVQAQIAAAAIPTTALRGDAKKEKEDDLSKRLFFFYKIASL